MNRRQARATNYSNPRATNDSYPRATNENDSDSAFPMVFPRSSLFINIMNQMDRQLLMRMVFLLGRTSSADVRMPSS
jgi:hypothetical protein